MASIDVTTRHLAATRGIEPDPSLDLVLWPENVVDSEDFGASEEYRAIAAEAARLGVPFAVGVTEDVPGQPGRITNYQVVIDTDGELTSRYDKVRRVPFGEYVPLRGLLEALGAPVDQVRTNAIAGTGPAVLELPSGAKLATVISWEVFFGGRAREGVEAGRQALVNPTNGASYTGTIVQTQQVASSRLRAVETGRWLVQAAPTGFSEFVAPDGDVIDRTAVSERTVSATSCRAARRPHVVRVARRRTVDPARGPDVRPRRSCSPLPTAAVHGLAPRSAVDDHRHRPVVDERHLHRRCGTVPWRPSRRTRAAPRRRRRRAARRPPGGRPRSSSGGGRPTCRRTA